MIRSRLPALLHCFTQELTCNLLDLLTLFVVDAVWQGDNKFEQRGSK